MTKDEVFKALSRNEDVLAADRDAALLWLLRLKGVSKSEADAILFIAECITGRPKLFATVRKDRQVLFIVEKRFCAYLDDRESKRRRELFPTVALDIEERERLIARQQSRSLSTRHKDAAEGVDEMDWNMKHATLVEQADDVRLTKETPFAQFLNVLKKKERDDKEVAFFLMLIKITLRENAKHSREDLALDAALRLDAMKRNPRIRSLAYRHTRAK